MKIFISFLFSIAVAFTAMFAQIDTWYADARIAYSNQNFAEADKLFTKVIENDPSHSDAYFFRGMCNLYTQDPVQAVEDLTEAIRLQPENPDAYNALGLAYGYMNETVRAIDNFDTAISLDPEFAQAYVNRGSALINTGDLPGALSDLNKAISLNSSNPESYYLRATVHYHSKNFEKAIDDYTKSVELGLINPKIYYNRGNSFYRLGKYEKAIENYTKAIELDPNDSQSLNNRAMAYDNSGQTEKAKADRKKLSEMAGKEFTPVEEISYKTYSADGGAIGFKYPSKWTVLKHEGEDVLDIVATEDQISSVADPYNVGVRMSMNRNMDKHFNVRGADSLIAFWRGSVLQNSKEYDEYSIISQKLFYSGKWKGQKNEVFIRISPQDYPLKMYEVVLACETDIIFAYFQAPEIQWGYYEEIFDEMIESLTVD